MSPDGAPAVELAGVVKAFDHRPVLRGVDLRVRAGQAVAILGANGSGKTTLLRLVASLTAPTRGTITLFGRQVPSREARRRIGLVPHESLLYDNLSVAENLRFFAGLYGLPGDRVAARMADASLAPLAGRRARVLSRGQRQQVNLTRALLHDPDLLLLDEPYTGLDVTAAARLTDLLRAERGRGRTLMLSTHALSEARVLDAEVAVLLAGRLTELLPTDALDEGRLAAWFRDGCR
jgi:ABC-type multidrug transport system ATPase subunit